MRPKQKKLEDYLIEYPGWSLLLAGVAVVIAQVGSRVPNLEVRAYAPLLNYLAVGLCALGARGALHRWARNRRFQAQDSRQSLQDMSWREFELLVSDLFRSWGMRVYEGSGSRDGGVDLTFIAPDGIPVLVQCKQYRAWSVGEPKVREFFGAMAAFGQPCRGIFVTCGEFTADARRFAENNRIELWNGDRLLREILQSNGEAARTNTSRAEHPKCPRCQQKMVRRTARRGKHRGETFWSCPNYPQCREILAA